MNNFHAYNYVTKIYVGKFNVNFVIFLVTSF